MAELTAFQIFSAPPEGERKLYLAIESTAELTAFLMFSAPPEGERKLYLAIESTAELAVQKAKVEITRLLKVITRFLK
jgi:hypothetical protein